MSQTENSTRAEAQSGDLRTACQAVLDDYQTSDTHHPDHVLIRRTDFERIKVLVEAPVIARAEAQDEGAAGAEWAKDEAFIVRLAAEQVRHTEGGISWRVLQRLIDAVQQRTARTARAEAQDEGAAGEPLRPVVFAFAHLMEAKLRENDWKRGWQKDSSLSLLARLREETDELAQRVQERADAQIAINPPPLPNWHTLIANEAADVANFAMMVADVCGGLPQSAVESIATARAHPSPTPAATGDAILDEDRMPVWPTPAVDEDRVRKLETVADLADELINRGGLDNRGMDCGLVVVEKADRSDPHYRLCLALEALKSTVAKEDNNVSTN